MSTSTRPDDGTGTGTGTGTDPGTSTGGPRVTVLGMLASGPDDAGLELVQDAEVLLGGARHLDLVPPVPGQERHRWPSPLADGLPDLLERVRGRRVVALASGDPMVSGIGTTLVRLLGPAAVRVVPAVSSVALARARMGWSAEESVVVTVVGRHEARVLREVAPGRRILVLTSGAATPSVLGELLTEVGLGDTMLTVLGDLGTTTESRDARPAAQWTSAPDGPDLHVLAVEVPRTSSPSSPSFPAGRSAYPAGRSAYPAGRSAWVAGLPDQAFENDGQLTRRDLRVAALARLAPVPGEHLWDVGAGAGSVGIEWMRAHPTCRTTAVEADDERAARIGRNARLLGVPDLRVVRGRAPQALSGLDEPDAIFIGGGATREGVLQACLAALRPGGRIVVHGVTVETEAVLAQAYSSHGGELTRIALETAAPVGTFTGWTPARTVTQWSWVRP